MAAPKLRGAAAMRQKKVQSNKEYFAKGQRQNAMMTQKKKAKK